MTIVTGTANTASTNVFDSDVLQAITSGTLGSHSSTQFEFSNDYFVLDAEGSGFGYSGGHPSAGTMTSLEFQLSTGISDWSSFSVSVASVWSAVSNGDTTAFGNLFFSGNDTFNMQLTNGQDILAGGAGNDTFNYAGNLSQSTHIDGGSGTNTLNLDGDGYNSDPYQFENVTNIQIIHLAAGHFYGITISPTAALTVDGSALGAGDSLYFQTSGSINFSMTVTGGAGNDTFVSGAGNDTFNGGAGSDTIDCSHATSGLTIDLNQTTIQGAAAGIGTDTISSVENAVGTQFNDTFIGTAADNTFLAAPANSFVGVGVDTFNGGAGNDTVSFAGASQGMTIDLRSGASHIAGTDTFTSIEKVIGSDYNDTFYGNSDNNVFDAGESGFDTIDYNGATGGMTFNMTSVVEIGSGFTTTIVATGGGQGTDTLTNFEHVVGTPFDDTFYLLTAPLDTDNTVTFDGGAGTDTVSFQYATSSVFPDLNQLGTSIEHIVGSAFDDTLDAPNNPVTIDGGAGNDTIKGSLGDDTLNGDDGNDTIEGETGNDIINGGAGDDILSGGGTYVAYGETGGNDILNGGDGNDTLYSGGPYDPNDGGNCILDGGPGDDQLIGSVGIDTATYQDATSGVTVSLNTAKPQDVGGGLGTDTLFSIENLIGSNYDDTLIGGGVPNVISGLGGNDTIDISQYNGDNYVNGKPGNDTVYGGDGDDTIIAGAVFAANDTIDGGAGNDTLLLNGDYSAGIIFGPTTMVNVELIKLSAGFSYKLTLNDANVAAGQTLTIDGSALTGTQTLTVDGSQETDGNLVLLGGAGNDVLIGGAGGNDTLLGGTGNDTIVVGSALTASDVIDGGAGNDTVVLNGDYSSRLSFGATTMVNVETLQLTSGHSYKMTMNDANVAPGQTLTVDGSTLGAGDTLIFNGSFEHDGNFVVTGGAGNDVITGGAGNDTLNGGSGNDTFDVSYGGYDVVSGGDGNDTINFGGAFTTADTVDGGTGNDTITLAGDYSSRLTFGATTMVNVETLQLAGGHSYKMTMNDANVAVGQTLTVNGSTLGASDTLTFNGSLEHDGNFVVTGGAGSDVITGGAGNDTLNGGGGNDTFDASFGGNDIVSGGGGDDTINFGGAFTAADTVDGGTGNDTVVLAGNYSTPVIFGAATMSNIEKINLASGHNYDLVLNDANVAAGQTLTVDGHTLGASNTLIFDGSQETDGNFILLGGAGNDRITGGAGNDTLNGGGGNDTIDASDGGNDTVLGGDGNDAINFGAAFTGFDEVNGGAGTDTLILNGDYSTAVMFSSTTMVGIEQISLAANHSYDLVLNDSNVAAGQTLTVNGQALTAIDVLSFDGSHETDGNFVIRGGAGNDILIGGAGNDTLIGGLGADHLTGGAGADVFVYKNAAQSTSINYDTISGFDFASADKIDLNFAVAAVDTSVAGGALSAATFDADLAASVDSAHLGKHHAVLFTPDSGDLAGQTFLVIDTNNAAGYQAGKDLVIHLDHPANLSSLDVTDFI
jgi:Ca2+-binding RTX toxin-like protein